MFWEVDIDLVSNFRNPLNEDEIIYPSAPSRLVPSTTSYVVNKNALAPKFKKSFTARSKLNEFTQKWSNDFKVGQMIQPGINVPNAPKKTKNQIKNMTPAQRRTYEFQNRREQAANGAEILSHTQVENQGPGGYYGPPVGAPMQQQQPFVPYGMGPPPMQMPNTMPGQMNQFGSNMPMQGMPNMQPDFQGPGNSMMQAPLGNYQNMNQAQQMPSRKRESSQNDFQQLGGPPAKLTNFSGNIDQTNAFQVPTSLSQGQTQHMANAPRNVDPRQQPQVQAQSNMTNTSNNGWGNPPSVLQNGQENSQNQNQSSQQNTNSYGFGSNPVQSNGQDNNTQNGWGQVQSVQKAQPSQPGTVPNSLQNWVPPSSLTKGADRIDQNPNHANTWRDNSQVNNSQDQGQVQGQTNQYGWGTQQAQSNTQSTQNGWGQQNSNLNPMIYSTASGRKEQQHPNFNLNRPVHAIQAIGYGPNSSVNAFSDGFRASTSGAGQNTNNKKWGKGKKRR